MKIDPRTIVPRPALVAVAVAVLVLSGCIGHSRQLREVQDAFNQANRIQPQTPGPDDLTAEQEAAFRNIVEKIENEQLKSVERDDLKVSAYAIDAFSKWRLKEFVAAKATAEEGLDIYERAGLKSNQRDYGMLLITGGLADYSQAFRGYRRWLREHPRDFLPAADAAAFSGRIADAMKKIDAVNRPDKGLKPDAPIVIYANQQQLLAITGILDIWGHVREFADQKDPVCHWTAKAAILVQDRFPSAGDYAGKARTDNLAREISAVRRSYRCE